MPQIRLQKLICISVFSAFGASKRFVLFQGIVHEQRLDPFEGLVVTQARRFGFAGGRLIHWAVFWFALLIRWIVQIWALNSSIIFILFYQLCCHVSRVLLRGHLSFSLLLSNFSILAYLVCEAH